jgi:hypothetical protein
MILAPSAGLCKPKALAQLSCLITPPTYFFLFIFAPLFEREGLHQNLNSTCLKILKNLVE